MCVAISSKWKRGSFNLGMFNLIRKVIGVTRVTLVSGDSILGWHHGKLPEVRWGGRGMKIMRKQLYHR